MQKEAVERMDGFLRWQQSIKIAVNLDRVGELSFSLEFTIVVNFGVEVL